MRPLRLELHGFAAFREETIVDFEGQELMAFTGPTGAGKSSIIDGIAFALFGSVARYGNEKLIAPIINTLSTEARVRLDFSVGKQRYTAVRILRRTATGASTKEARLERQEAKSSPTVLAGTAAEVTAAVEELLGLSFGQFTKTIVLPQGDFARFLTETAGDRQSLLRRLLGMDVYAAMGTAARQRAKDAGIEAEATRQALGNSEVVTNAMLTRLNKAVEKVNAATKEAGETNEQLIAAVAASDDNAEQLDELDDSLSKLEAVVLSEEAERYGVEAASADKAVAAAQKSLEALQTKRSTAVDALDALPTAEEVADDLALRDSLDEVKRSLKELEASEKESASQSAEAERAVVDIEGQLEAARTELEDVRFAAGAAGIAATISVGDACPVCSQVVSELPDAHTHDVSKFEAAVAKIEGASRDARNVSAELATRATRATADASHEREALADITGRLEDVSTRSQLKTVATRIEKATTKLDEASEAADTASAEAEAAIEARATLDERALELRRDFSEVRDAVASLDPPVPAHADLSADWEELVQWGDERRAGLEKERKALAAEGAKAEKAVESLQKQMSRHAKPFSLEGNGHVYELLVQHQTQAIAARDDAIFRKQRDAINAERITELMEEQTVAAELGSLLSAKGFEQWLMVDVMIDLAERATERLSVLSSNAYSLTTDGTDFSVIDHRNANEERSARTLSGGETFLASLALALALADSITDLGSTVIPPTESVFLDEGFGTLDGETLDVVASAIEELGAAGRLVVIVTHITELADRLPQHVRVSRTATGSTVSQTEEVR